MLSKADTYRQMILKATKRKILIHNNNQEKKSTVRFECDIKLPSSHPFRSSQQIENNISITNHITNQSSKQYPITLQNQWPKSCIGLILCEHHQNNQTLYVYGTGILIHKNIVFTSAQNVYCRRLNKQYTNIRFIVGVSNNKCSGIYDVKRIHYPKEYTMQEDYENYNFAVFLLYDDLSDSCGYVGWKTIENLEVDEEYSEYGYTSGNKEGSFKLRKIIKNEQQQDYCLRNGVLIKQNESKYSILGMKHSKKQHFLSEKIRNKINQWTESRTIYLANNSIDAQVCKYIIQINWTHATTIKLWDTNIGAQGCKYLSQANWTHLTQVILQGNNNISGQGCKYLSQANWTHLNTINLCYNKIGAQGCKYLSQANWIRLTTIDLCSSNINQQGCKYISQANWIHLTKIHLSNNKIGAQGCKYLSQGDWLHLKSINLWGNKIGAQGCKYLSQANWTYLNILLLGYNNIDGQGCKYLSQANWKRLTTIYLANNNIGAQGSKYLSQTNWKHLNTINLSCDYISAQGCKYLSQSNWIHLKQIILQNNKIDLQGCKYLSQANWIYLTMINLGYNNIKNISYRLLLLELYSSSIMKI